MLENAAATIATPIVRRALRPADAASLVLVDRSGDEPRFLMGRRHHGHAFMPGRLVFPGGRLDTCDRAMPAFGTLPAATERKLMAGVAPPSLGLARALALCAIREMAEETGLLVGETGFGEAPEAPPAWSDFARLAVFPSLEALHLFARAITPPGHPRRFDTRFFAAEASAVAARLDNVVGPQSELVELKWLSADETADENLAPITRAILAELALRLDSGLDSDMPLPFFAERRKRWGREEL